MSEYTPEMAHAAAARGAAWMDKHCPHWINEINLAKLNLANGSYCILGQAAPCLLPDRTRADYRDVVKEYWPTGMDGVATRLGFNVPIWERARAYGTAAYEMLTIAWQLEVRQRLEAKS